MVSPPSSTKKTYRFRTYKQRLEGLNILNHLYKTFYVSFILIIVALVLPSHPEQIAPFEIDLTIERGQTEVNTFIVNLEEGLQT